MAILLFLVMHSILSVFCQSFFLHRYSAHRMFTLTPFWEKFFYLMTYITQGSSFLNPRAYAVLHREHHAHSDSPDDPHSPHQYPGFVSMMLGTKKRYDALVDSDEGAGHAPAWKFIDDIGTSAASSAVWAVLYTSYYIVFAEHWWMYFLLPIHFFMGPIHGAIVNWCGHLYGYRNFELGDESRNTLLFDFITLGELFQNNHHKFPARPNFAVRWFEWDPTYTMMVLFDAVGIIDMPRRARYAAGRKRVGVK